MGLIDVADDIANDFVSKGVQATVYFGPEFKAQDDAAGRIVIVPNRDKFDRLQHPNGQNPRPLFTRHAGATAQIWAAAPLNLTPAERPPADWRALDLLINAFVSSLWLTHPGMVEIGDGVVNTKNPHVAWGKQYDLQFWILHPIIDQPWPTEAGITRGGHTYLRFSDKDEQADA
jgi:hypothetical protein